MTTTTHTTDRWLVPAAWAGIIGPILFFLTWVAQELFLTDGYSPIEQPVSALAAWPHGWVQDVNFIVFGVLTIAFAIGLHRGLAPSRFGIVGPALFAVTGVGLLWASAFPLERDPTGAVYDPGLHVVGGGMFFPGSVLALLVISFRVAQDPIWRPLTGWLRASGLILLVSMPLFGMLAAADDAPLHDWGGLWQRVAVALILLPRLALSYRLLRSGRETRKARPAAGLSTMK